MPRVTVFNDLCYAGGPTAALVQARATHGACEGTWYYELTIVHLGASGHVRLGWSTRKGELQAPVRFSPHPSSMQSDAMEQTVTLFRHPPVVGGL